jgi:hypothetical protein
MDEPGSLPRQPPLWRIGFFLRDLFPENNLQWLFPLASLLLLIGWDYWRVLSSPRSSPRILYAAMFLRVVLQIAYTASFILWSVRVRNPLRSFVWWVLLPVILESLCAPLILTSAFVVHVSALESPLQIARDQVLSAPVPIRFLGLPFYGPLAGIAVFAGSLWALRRGRVQLPVRFRGSGAAPADPENASAPFRFWVQRPSSLGRRGAISGERTTLSPSCYRSPSF